MKLAAIVCALCAALVGGAASASAPPSGSVQGRVLVNPLVVTLAVPTGAVKAGQSFRIQALVANIGRTTLQNVAVTLVVPQPLVLRDKATQAFSSLGPAQVRAVAWSACTTTPGGYIVMARATAGPFTSESTGQLVQIAPANRPRC